MTIPGPIIGSFPAPIKTVWVKSGFALGPAEYFFKSARPLRMEIEGLRLLSPAQIRDLLQKRTSIEEVKMLIEEESNPTYIYRGKIQIEKAHFRLIDVDFRCRDDETILKANLADLREGEGDEGFLYTGTRDDFIGEIETRESGGTGKGYLVINQGIFSGRYTVHLDVPVGGEHL